jgi:hypothetical protein
VAATSSPKPTPPASPSQSVSGRIARHARSLSNTPILQRLHGHKRESLNSSASASDQDVALLAQNEPLTSNLGPRNRAQSMRASLRSKSDLVCSWRDV